MATKDVFQLVTDRIVEQLEQGVVPWQCPWVKGNDEQAINYMTRKPYSLLNQILLWRGGEYLTFKQCKALGGSIKKGARSSIVVFYTMSTEKRKTVIDEETGEEQEVTITKHYDMPVLKAYHVFHISDCEGIESKLATGEQQSYEHDPVTEAEAVITGYVGREKSLRFLNDTQSNRAYYSPLYDEVRVPMISQFKEVEEYYSTAFHELTHSTGIQGRCDRKSEMKGVSYFGNENYSREELVAEISAAMLCGMVGIDADKAFNNSVAYIHGWMEHLKNHHKEFVWAARHAEQAVKYIMNIKDN